MTGERVARALRFKIPMTNTVGTTTTIVATGFDITLDSAASVYTGALILTGKHIAVTTDSAAVLGATTATGTYTVTANGNITEVAGGAKLTITGTFTLDASSGANTITIVATVNGTDDDVFSTLPLMLLVGVGGTVNSTP